MSLDLQHGRRRAALVAAMAATTWFASCGDEPQAMRPTTPPGGLNERPFSSNSPWNTRIDMAPADANSAAALRLAAARRAVTTTSVGTLQRSATRTPAGGIVINTDRWTTLVVSGGAATQLRCRQQPCGDPADRLPRTLAIPANAKPDPRYDGWMTVIDGGTAYDLWRARRLADGSISYAFARRWSLTGAGTGDPRRPSVRGSGLPLVAGLITESELARGEINHALAIAVPSPAAGRSVSPASATNGSGPGDSVALGARLRLRADVRLPSRTPAGRRLSRQQERARDAMLVALRRYGAIVVDRSETPALYARAGIPAAALTGDELTALELDDFEVLQAPAQAPEGTEAS